MALIHEIDPPAGGTAIANVKVARSRRGKGSAKRTLVQEGVICVHGEVSIDNETQADEVAALVREGFNQFTDEELNDPPPPGAEPLDLSGATNFDYHFDEIPAFCPDSNTSTGLTQNHLAVWSRFGADWIGPAAQVEFLGKASAFTDCEFKKKARKAKAAKAAKPRKKVAKTKGVPKKKSTKKAKKRQR